MSIKTKKVMMHTKIVLWVTAILIVGGGIFFAIFEWNNSKTIGQMNGADKILNSFFLSVTSRTAGFNSVPIEDMYGISKLFCIILMFIGAAPGSTGGGIKVTTIFVIIMTVVSVIRGKEETVIYCNDCSFC